MTDFYKDFSAVNETEWLEKVKGDLKGKSIEEVLHKYHPIEEINYQRYGLANDKKDQHTLPGQADYARGGKTQDNDWINNVNVPVDEPKVMNAFAHQQLMNGATGLTFNFSSFSIEECKTIVEDIQFEHITSTFYYSAKSQFDWINGLSTSKNYSGTAINLGKESFGQIKETRNRLINALDVQYAGGNVHQEIAYALYEGHEQLYQLINKGVKVDDAVAQLKFRFGIGSNFLFEIAKFKVFRALWYTVVEAYQPAHNCSHIPYMEAATGFLNKSLKDPHNNLLRQTTEALSAVLGGIDELTIQPYDTWSTDQNIKRTQRLGLNIALLLKEESYLDKVIDPAGGAYIQEDLFESLKEKAWSTFQQLEKEGVDFLKKDIDSIARKRVKQIENKSNTLIGINQYFNDKPESANWKTEYKTPFGTPLILEKDCQIEVEL